MFICSKMSVKDIVLIVFLIKISDPSQENWWNKEMDKQKSAKII